MKKCGCGGGMKAGGSTGKTGRANLDVVANQKLAQIRSYANPPKGKNGGTTTTGVINNYNGYTGRTPKTKKV